MATRYCVGTPLNSTAAWSTTSGGASGASVPQDADDAIFDAASPNCSVGTNRSFGSLNFTGYTNTITMDANISVTGAITLSPTMTIVDSGGWLISNGTTGQVLTSNGKTWEATFRIAGSTVNPTLADIWTVKTLSSGLTSNSNQCNGNKIRVQGDWNIDYTSGTLSGTTEIELIGTGTVTWIGGSSGCIRVPVTFAAGSNYSIVGQFTYGLSLLKKDAAATLNMSAATLRVYTSCSIDMSGYTVPAFTCVTNTVTTLVSPLTIANFSPDAGSVWLTGAKLTLTGTATFVTTSGNITTTDVDFVGPVSVSGLFTTGGIVGNVTFVSGTTTLTGSIGFKIGTVTRAGGAIVDASATTLQIVSNTTFDMNGQVWPVVAWTAGATTITLTTPLIFGVTSIGVSNAGYTHVGAKLTITGNTTITPTTGNFTTSDVDFVGPLTLTCSHTTGRIAGNVNFVSGTITLVGTIGHGGGNLTKSPSCTLITGSSTLILQGAASTVDLSPAVLNNVTLIGSSITHTLNSNLRCGGILSLGSTTSTTTINGAEIVLTGPSLTSSCTTGRVLGTSPVRIKENCTISAPVMTVGGHISLPHIVDAPGKTVTLTNWVTDSALWQVLAGTIVNAAGQTWVNTSYIVQRFGREVDPFLGPNSNPRLYFRAWTSNTGIATPLTTLTASSISTAHYRRKVNGIYGGAISVGVLIDAAEFSSYSVGRVIKHSCALGNLYSIDAPLAATLEGAEAVRLELSLTSGTVDVIDHILKIGYSTLEDTTINNIALDLSPILTTEMSPSLAAELSPILTAEMTPLLAAELSPILAAEMSPILAADLSPILTAEMSPVLASGLSPILTAEMSPVLAEELWETDFGELSSVPSALSTMRDKISWLFMWARNKATQTDSHRKLYADNGTTIVGTESVSDDGTTFTKGEAQ